MASKETELGTIAMFDASDDTVAILRGLVTEAGASQTVIARPFVEVKLGITDFRKYLDHHNPEVVIFEIAAPYDDNWAFFMTVRDAGVMRGRGVVVISPSRQRLDEVIGENSHALGITGSIANGARILEEINAATLVARTARRQNRESEPSLPAVDSARTLLVPALPR